LWAFINLLALILKIRERSPANWAGVLSLLDPVVDAFLVEDVLFVAFQLRYFISWLKFHGANYAFFLYFMD